MTNYWELTKVNQKSIYVCCLQVINNKKLLSQFNKQNKELKQTQKVQMTLTQPEMNLVTKPTSDGASDEKTLQVETKPIYFSFSVCCH